MLQDYISLLENKKTLKDMLKTCLRSPAHAETLGQLSMIAFDYRHV